MEQNTLELSRSEIVHAVVLGNGGSALGIARSLGRLGVPVHAVSSFPQLAVLYSRYCHTKLLSEFYSCSLPGLLNLGEQIGRKSILIPTDEQSSAFMEDHAEGLQEWFKFPNPLGLARLLSNKKEMQLLARRCAVPTPEAVFPKCRQDAIDFVTAASFPIMIKRVDGIGFPWNKAIARTKTELLKQYDALADSPEPNLMLQEYIPAEGDLGWIFHGYFNCRSDCLFGYTGIKLRQWPAYHGVTTLGVTVHNECLSETARRFMKEIGYQGIVDIDFREDSRDGKYNVLDVNPRVGGNFRMFVSDTGMDVVRALYMDMIGNEVIAGKVPEGRKWMVEDADLRASIRYHADAALSIKAWLSSLRGVGELALFAFDDPFPILHALVHKIGVTLASRLT